MRRFRIVFKLNGSKRTTTRTIEASSAASAVSQLIGSYSNEDTIEIVSITLV